MEEELKGSQVRPEPLNLTQSVGNLTNSVGLTQSTVDKMGIYEETPLIEEKVESEIEEDDERFCTCSKVAHIWIKLNEGVRLHHLYGLFLFKFILEFGLLFNITFLPQLLAEKYYHGDESKSGKVAGNVGFYTNLVQVAVGLIIGFLLDFFGRKLLSLFGLICIGLATAAMPFVTTVYPGILGLNIAVMTGVLPCFNSPFIVDYV